MLHDRMFRVLVLGGIALVIGCSTSSAGQGGDADSSTTSSSDGSASGSSSGGGSDSSGGPALRWYSTCGDPVCHTALPDAGGLTDEAGTPCPTLGATCSVDGAYCGTSNPYFNCGATEECAPTDPTMNPNGCPMH
jgi:hypothetical protein